MNLASLSFNSNPMVSNPMLFSSNPTVFFHGPVPIISNSDPLIEKDPAIPAARFLSDWIPGVSLRDTSLRADRFGSAIDALARFGLLRVRQ